MTWNKGIGPLLAAFARHRQKNPSAVLVLKGGDQLYGHQLRRSFEEARKLCPEVGSRDAMTSVRYLPQNLPQATLAKLYQASDVYVSPYRAEGFNLPVLEALACGTPVIVTAGGSTDDFCPGDSVLKVDAERVNTGTLRHLEPSIASLIDRMQEIADTASARRRRVEEARHWLVDRYSWQAVTRSLVDLMVKGE
jgi:glycosyltransferase involved in cell wall biosynthesis